MNDTEKKSERKLARAKFLYLTLCETLDSYHLTLSGKSRGHWKTWKMLEKQMFLGKKFFDDIKGIEELYKELKLEIPETGENMSAGKSEHTDAKQVSQSGNKA